MFLSTSSYRLSTRLPYFTGNGKEPEPASEQPTSQPASSSLAADSFASQKAAPSIVKTATSALTHLLTSRILASAGEGSEGPGAVPRQSQEGAGQHALPVILEQPEIDAPSAPSGEGHQATQLHKIPKHVSKTRPEPALRIYGNLEKDLAEAMQDASQADAPDSPFLLPVKTLKAPTSPLPLNVPRFPATATSLALPSRMHSRATSRRQSISQKAESSDLSSSQFSDTTSAWLAGQDADVQEEREARKAQKNTKTASSYAASAASAESLDDENDEGDLSDHSLEGDSQLDDEDYALYREELEYDGSDTDEAASVSKKSAPRAIPKRKDPFAELFRSKSPQEIQEAASLPPHPSLLSKALMSPEARKIHDLISSYRAKVEQDFASLNQATMRQKQQEADNENIRLCSKYSLEGLKQRRSTLADHLGYNQYRASKWRNGLRESQWMTKVGIPPEAFTPEVMEARLAELNARNLDLTIQLEALPHPGLGHRSRSGSSVKRERDTLKEERDQVLDYVSEIESNMHTFEAFRMRLEQLNFQLHQNSQAIQMKRKAIMLNQLAEVPEHQDGQVKLWRRLADNTSPEELEQIKEMLVKPEELEKYKKLLNKEFRPNVKQEDILRKAKDFQQTRHADLINLLKKISPETDGQEQLEQRLAQDFTYRELMRMGYQLSRNQDPENGLKMTILKSALNRQTAGNSAG